jgi:hypothetical protein
LHHPLALAATGAKLSKVNRDTGIRELRAAGVRPGEVLGAAAHATGCLTAPASLTPADLGDLFVPV